MSHLGSLGLLWAAACDPQGQTGTSSSLLDPTSVAVPDLPGSVSFDVISSAVDSAIGTLVRVSWEQVGTATVHVEYSFDPGVWLSTPQRALGDGPHTEILLGVPYDSEVAWRFVADTADGRIEAPEVTTKTAPPPAGLPITTVLVDEAAEADAAGAPYLFASLAGPIDFGDPWWVVIMDRKGRMVWSTRSEEWRVSMHPRVARDGKSLLIDQNSYWAIFDRGMRSQVWQILIDGTVQHVFDTPGLHHPFTDLPDGSIAYGEAVGFYKTEQITVVHRDATREGLFDCEAWLDAQFIFDFCSSNTLNYDETTDSYLFTLWSIESVLQIDAQSGGVKRTFGHIPGTWNFVPQSSVFWNPHGAVLTSEGTVLLSSDLTTNGVETVVREYRLDETYDDLIEVWNFGVGEGVYGLEMGEAVRLPNGNTWHNYGDLPRLREVTPDGRVVWDVKWNTTAVGRTMPITDLYALAPPRP
jgi:hypothetical protein